MKRIDEAAARIYTGLWRLIADWLRVPKEPPTLPAAPGETIESVRPAPGFLAYLKLWFWIACFAIDIAIFAVWIAIGVAAWWLALLLLPVVLFVAVVPDIVAYIAVHLRYDSTWYVFSDRSVRIRRGIWTLHEVTVTFENVQNIGIEQGPVQRWFGIADVVIETAGGAGTGPQGQTIVSNRAVLEGVAEAGRIRDRILERVKGSRGAGLGDEGVREARTHVAACSPFRPEHLRVLEEVRDAARALSRPR